MNLELTILKSLSLVHPRLMTVGTLWSEVRLDQDSATYTEFKAALTSLEEKGQAIVVIGEDRHKAKITDAGRARLLE